MSAQLEDTRHRKAAFAVTLSLVIAGGLLAPFVGLAFALIGFLPQLNLSTRMLRWLFLTALLMTVVLFIPAILDLRAPSATFD